jgi:general secretion pathway protein A
MSADPRFLYLTPQHREAATGLIYSVLKHKGMATLTGEAGTGKTTVLRAVLTAMSAASVKVSYVPVPTLTPAEFLEFILLQFGLLNLARANKAERLLLFERFLLSSQEKNQTSLLIVDEAHKLSKELLEEIRLLTNFDTRAGMLLQIVLAGQSELDELLRESDLGQFKQRIAYRFSLHGLTGDEVEAYIAHRWSRAGGSPAPPFDAEAIRHIALYSGGIPRLINAICDNTLVMAFADNAPVVTAAGVHEAARDLDLVRDERLVPVGTNGNGGGGMSELELLALASSAVRGAGLPALERKDSPRKESWLVRSARRLLSGRQPAPPNE